MLTSFFENVSKNINIFSLQINLKILLLIGIPLLSVCVFFLIYIVFRKLFIQKRLKKRNIRINNSSLKKYNLLNKLVDHFDKEKIELKLIHSGNIMGLNNVETYFVYRIIFTIVGLILGLFLYNPLSILRSILVIICCGLLGFLTLDLILRKSKQKRIRSIKEQLPIFLISFDNYTKAGLLFDDIIDTMFVMVKGDLRKELIRFNVSYSLSKDFEGSMKEFTKRLGFIESEEIEIKMRQCYYSGIYDDVLTNEKELIEKKVINDMKKETEMYSLYLVFVMSLTIINVFLLVIMPLLGVAREGLKFLKI